MKAAAEAAQTRGDMQDDFDFKAQSPLMMAREQEDIHPFRAVFTKLVSVTRERDALRAENERLRISMDAMQGANDALLAAGEDHDDFEAMVARIILDRDALRQRVASAEATLNDLIRDAHERVYDWQSSGVDDEAELWRRTELAYRQALALLSGAAPK